MLHFQNKPQNKTVRALFFWLAIALLTVFVVGLALFAFSQKSSSQNNQKTGSASCAIHSAIKTVRGGSLDPLFHDGDQVEALVGYYTCHPVERGDTVIISWAGHDTPIIKLVRGVPGDTFRMKEDTERHVWSVIVNDEVLTNSEGRPYEIPDEHAKLLRLYAEDPSGIIPSGAYLVLGNMPAGSLDGTRFGLVGKDEFIAQAVRLESR